MRVFITLELCSRLTPSVCFWTCIDDVTAVWSYDSNVGWLQFFTGNSMTIKESNFSFENRMWLFYEQLFWHKLYRLHKWQIFLSKYVPSQKGKTWVTLAEARNICHAVKQNMHNTHYINTQNKLEKTKQLLMSVGWGLCGNRLTLSLSTYPNGKESSHRTYFCQGHNYHSCTASHPLC